MRPNSYLTRSLPAILLAAVPLLACSAAPDERARQGGAQGQAYDQRYGEAGDRRDQPRDDAQEAEPLAPENPDAPDTSGDSAPFADGDESDMIVRPPPVESASDMMVVPPPTGTSDDMIEVPPPVEFDPETDPEADPRPAAPGNANATPAPQRSQPR